ncbi:MAG: bifunctional (p)ppGpp synthetase/guanosine-3',5'-bis(diphosphate) 3'-pyrophosphohydrolase [Chitinophagales bacterium]|nr:bifunctional (p)ppGpp synthetase/guanosine-3',5'-bis(diphosphate) 3'-pyrophosphohydrolase [Chitinophagales bacterium]
MENPVLTPDNEQEKKEILKHYRHLLRVVKPRLNSEEDRRLLRKAFELSLNAHKNMRRKSGDPYILHPLAVATITVEEMGLGVTSVICALLHDTVEDTEVSLDEIRKDFGDSVAKIVDGLTKISEVFDLKSSQQAENFRKLIFSLTDDMRVILIKIADRLHNMRTLEHMPRNKQLKIASETSFLYAPLAHRLGFYAIKSELEDLTMKYTETDIYRLIANKLNESKRERAKYINEFIKPIEERIAKEKDLKFRIFGRPKSINSIWNKMKNQGVEFEQVYDLFAIRVILDSPHEREKADCWKVYSIITDFFRPNPRRLRDWISNPKANGYEALHTTVMGPGGRWVEVQIRSDRMDEIAEKGYAAHFKYKEGTTDTALDEWLMKMREIIKNPDSNTLDFIDDFRLNLFSQEIYIFTPKGQLKRLPAGSTALDFAFDVHTDIGLSCIGAKVNHKLVPLSHKLNNGDQVEIITSKKQKPNEDWLNYVVSGKAKSKIKSALKEDQKMLAAEGKEILERRFKALKVNSSSALLNDLAAYFKLDSVMDFYGSVATKKIDTKTLTREMFDGDKLIVVKEPEKKEQQQKEENFEEAVRNTLNKNAELLIFGDNKEKLDYKFAPCCNPIPGDDVFGFITINEGIKIHKTNCPNATQLMSNYGYRIIKTRWTKQHEIAFLTELKISGIDDIGVMNKITNIISSDMKINMRSISLDTKDGIFEGTITLFVHDTAQLDVLINRLKSIEGLLSISRQ